jgi:hypothetical protein
MLTEQANRRLRSLHAKAGADPELIEADTLRILLSVGGVSEIDNKVLAPQTRSSFFEVWSAFWLLPSEIPKEIKRELGAAMLASWTGIAQIDRSVDELGYDHSDDPLRRRACIWSEVVQARLGRESEWPQLVRRWSTRNHGMHNGLSAREVVLQKNPFYPEVFRVYLGKSQETDRLGRSYTLVVGIMDEAADVVDDAANGRPNFLLQESKDGILVKHDLGPLVNHILARGLIGQALAEARELLSSLKMEARALGFSMFSEVLSGLDLSFYNYEEFCTARAIAYDRRELDSKHREQSVRRS